MFEQQDFFGVSGCSSFCPFCRVGLDWMNEDDCSQTDETVSFNVADFEEFWIALILYSFQTTFRVWLNLTKKVALTSYSAQ